MPHCGRCLWLETKRPGADGVRASWLDDVVVSNRLRHSDLSPELDPNELLCIRNVECADRAADPRVDGRVDDVVDGSELAQRVRDCCLVADIRGRA